MDDNWRRGIGDNRRMGAEEMTKTSKKEFLKYLRGLIKRIEPKLPDEAPELEMMEITFTEIRHVYTTELCAEKKPKRRKICI